MDLTKSIRSLAALKPSEAPFISVYLNLDGGERTREAAIRFLKEKAEDILAEYRGDKEREKSVRMSLMWMENWVQTHVRDEHKGLALFAGWTEQDVFCLPVPLPVGVETRVVVDNVPHIFPLVEFVEEAYHFMVMISDSEKAKIFEVRFGRIEDVQQIIRPDDEKSFRGEWTKMHYQNWKKDKTRRFVKKKIEVLAEVMLSRGIEHLVLCGDEAMLAQVRQELPKWLQSRVVTFAAMGTRTVEQQIIARTLEAFARFEREEEHNALELLRREVLLGGLGVAGIARTIMALNHKCVDELILNAGFSTQRVQQCRLCDWLALMGPRCPQCSGGYLIDVDLREEMVRRAVIGGAYIEIVDDDAWLSNYGGVGALLRYRPWEQVISSPETKTVEQSGESL